MRRLLATSGLALLAFCALASNALGATPKPTVTSVSPGQVAIGGTLVLKGKNFASGTRNNRVFFSRATDGKSVRVRPKKATKTRLTVVVPVALQALLADDGTGGKKPTRFRLMVFTKVLGPKTKTSRSPIIFPAGSAPTNTGGGTTGATPPPPPPPDCDADGTPDATDADDDNDGLGDDVEAAIHTNPCNPDTDGDGVGDAYEYYASLDLNGTPNYASKRPYPNPLDPSDAGKDFDGDGLTMAEEYAASKATGTATSSPLTYSDGNQQSVAAANAGGRDYDTNGRVTDEEKDADNDGIANWVELAKGSTKDADKISFGFFKNPNGTPCSIVGTVRFQDCGAGTIPNGNTYTDGSFASYFVPNWLDSDSDGDGIPDGADDLDHDSIPDVNELNAGSSPVNPCDPNTESRACQQH